MTEQPIDLESIRARVDEATRLSEAARPFRPDEAEYGAWMEDDQAFIDRRKANAHFLLGGIGLMKQLAADCAALLAECERLRLAVAEQTSEAIRWRGEHETAVHKLAIADRRVAVLEERKQGIASRCRADAEGGEQ